MAMGGWVHSGANVTARVTVPDGWVDPYEAQQIRIWGLERWKQLKSLQEKGRTKSLPTLDNKSTA